MIVRGGQGHFKALRQIGRDMEKEFEKRLRELMQKSNKLTLKSKELAEQTDRVIQEFRKKKKADAERFNKKLGSS